MRDVAFIGLAVILFALMAGLARLCQWVKPR